MHRATGLKVYTFNPLDDRRWQRFVDSHPNASVFHGRGWLEALQRTYGYEPVAYSTCSPSRPLSNAIVFCRVNSWLTGRRLVSLPFADHCEPLVDHPDDRLALVAALTKTLHNKSTGPGFKYVEIRALNAKPLTATGAACAREFALHSLDLGPPISQIYDRTHKSTVQRKIQRAGREGLCYESGNSETLLNSFYRLMVLTRRRHRLPPQPIEWFRNLAAAMRDQLTVRVATKNGKPIAALLTLNARQSITYKYACSDAGYHHLGGIAFLFWNAIQEAKQLGFETFDLGRSDYDNLGLITFKERWGARAISTSYVRLGAMPTERAAFHRASKAVGCLFAWMPDKMLIASGRLLYRHIG